MMQATKTTSYSYLLIGSGRVARHLGHYFNLKNIAHETWDRSQDPLAIRSKIKNATHILTAISDSALQGFYRQNLEGHEKTFVHFSGSMAIPDMISAHPLMTFGSDLYDLSTYEAMHFVMCGGTFTEGLPGLENKSSVIAAEDKPLYHAACVLGGNFSSLLIKKMTEIFSELSIPKEASEIYLHQVLKNILQDPEKALTGPMARKDMASVEKNLEALANDPYQDIYLSFLKAHWPDYGRSKK